MPPATASASRAPRPERRDRHHARRPDRPPARVGQRAPDATAWPAPSGRAGRPSATSRSGAARPRTGASTSAFQARPSGRLASAAAFRPSTRTIAVTPYGPLRASRMIESARSRDQPPPRPSHESASPSRWRPPVRRRPQRDEEHRADARRHDAVGRERREGEARAEREPDHGEPARRTAEVAGDPAPRKRQDRQVAEGDERAAERASWIRSPDAAVAGWSREPPGGSSAVRRDRRRSGAAGSGAAWSPRSRAA